MIQSRYLLFSAMLLLMMACTSYRPQGFTGGFTEIPLSATAYHIKARGNAFASDQKITAIALVRAAELAYNNGYDRFVLLDLAAYHNLTAYTTPGSSRTTTAVAGRATSFGNTTYLTGGAVSRTTYYPPQTTYFKKPVTEMVVKFLRPDDPGAREALTVSQIFATYAKLAGYKGEIPSQQVVNLSAPEVASDQTISDTNSGEQAPSPPGQESLESQCTSHAQQINPLASVQRSIFRRCMESPGQFLN